jgi:hypothetical protein
MREDKKNKYKEEEHSLNQNIDTANIAAVSTPAAVATIAAVASAVVTLPTIATPPIDAIPATVATADYVNFSQTRPTVDTPTAKETRDGSTTTVETFGEDRAAIEMLLSSPVKHFQDVLQNLEEAKKEKVQNHIVIGGIVCVPSRFLTWPGQILKIDGDIITVNKFGKINVKQAIHIDKVELFDMGKMNSESSEIKTAYKKAKLIFESRC